MWISEGHRKEPDCSRKEEGVRGNATDKLSRVCLYQKHLMNQKRLRSRLYTGINGKSVEVQTFLRCLHLSFVKCQSVSMLNVQKII